MPLRLDPHWHSPKSSRYLAVSDAIGWHLVSAAEVDTCRISYAL
jgi:hypothetical protein